MSCARFAGLWWWRYETRTMLEGERIIITSRVKHCPVCSIDLKVHIEVVPPLDQVPCNTKLLDDLRIIGQLYKERLISSEAFHYFATIGFNFQTILVFKNLHTWVSVEDIGINRMTIVLLCWNERLTALYFRIAFVKTNNTTKTTLISFWIWYINEVSAHFQVK